MPPMLFLLVRGMVLVQNIAHTYHVLLISMWFTNAGRNQSQVGQPGENQQVNAGAHASKIHFSVLFRIIC